MCSSFSRKMADLRQCVEWRILGKSAGTFWLEGDLDSALQVNREQVAEAFGINRRTPFFFGIWNRLWMDSPLTAQRLTALKNLFSDYLPQNELERDRLASFRVALATAEAEGAELEVLLTPPGHSDFGRTTIYPHCPRCKVAVSASVAPPEKASVVACELCGTSFHPSDTYSSVPTAI
jgi:hypothetical protein